MRVGVTGARGLLGTTLVPLWRAAGADVVAWDLDDFDVRDAGAVRRAILDTKPDLVIHAAAYTAVDRAESEPDVAMAVNRDGTAIVCRACREAGARVVYISTDYVFDGRATAPIPPDAPRRPLGAYGRSKAAGEEVGLSAGAEAMVVRSGWMYGPGRSNFVAVMADAAKRGRPVDVVNDLVGAPTSSRLLSEALWGLAQRVASGIWHVAPRGRASWFEVACEIFEAAGEPRRKVRPCRAADSGRAAPRPAYSVLDASGTERTLGVTFPDWRTHVRAYVAGEEPPGLGLVAGSAA